MGKGQTFISFISAPVNAAGGALKRGAAAVEQAQQDKPSESASALQKLGAGFASGIGAIGLVVFTGGAVEWVRFKEAGLPETEAVAAIPRNELIVDGAHALALFLVAGAVAVVLAYIVDDKARAWHMLAVAVLLGVIGLFYAREATELTDGSMRILAAVTLALALAVFGIAVRTGKRFLWVGVSLFIAVGFFGGFSAYLDTRDHPKVQPLALLRGPHDFGVIGIYVTMNDKRLYFRTLRPGEDYTGVPYRSGLFVFPCSEVSAAAIGRYQEPGENSEDAIRQSMQLLRQLRAARVLAGLNAPKSDAETSTGPAKASANASNADAAKANSAGPPVPSKAIC